MIQLAESLQAWGSPDFEPVFRYELAQLGMAHLPLQQALTSSSVALDDPLQIMLISCSDSDAVLHIKAGIFYTGIIAGCNCADDPSPQDVNSEYCVVDVTIDKLTAAATVTLHAGA